MGKAIIIDGNSLLYRVYYANKSFQKDTPTKEDTEKQKEVLLISVKKTCGSFLNHGEYKYLVIAFDSTKETFRRKKLQDYKANRASMPQVLVESLDTIKKEIAEMGFNIVPAPIPYEADDVICTLAKSFDKKGIKSDIFSADKDLLQLVSYFTTVFLCKTKGIKVENNFRNFQEHNEGLNPNQIPQLKAISGDSSDNYKGAKGIGEKTATDLLLKYGSIDKIYKNLNELSEKQRETFNECKRDVYDCLDIATTRDNVEISVNPQDYLKKN